MKEVKFFGKTWSVQGEHRSIKFTEELVRAAIVHSVGAGEKEGYVLADAKFAEWVFQNPSARLPEFLRTKQGRFYIRLGTRMVNEDGQVRLLALRCDGYHLSKLVVDEDVREGRVPMYEVFLPAALAA